MILADIKLGRWYFDSRHGLVKALAFNGKTLVFVLEMNATRGVNIKAKYLSETDQPMERKVSGAAAFMYAACTFVGIMAGYAIKALTG